MEAEQLNWVTAPKNGVEVFFSRATYEKYSMSPNLLELWHLANCPSQENEKASEKGDLTSTQPAAPTTEKNEEKLQPTLSIVPLPEPATSYPFFSHLTAADHRVYVNLLAKFSNRNYMSIPCGHQKLEFLKYLCFRESLQSEISEFLKFMQNNARNCVADYDHITKDALRYTEELINASMQHVKKYPESYILQEITSIMGGKVCTDLAFKLEKNVLALGKANIVKVCFPVMPSLLPVPVDYKTVSMSMPAEKRAATQHQDISSDPNAEKLALKYRPQVALTTESLFTLMNNHGINYKEQWELPVCVKKLQVIGGEPISVVFVNPPLPKKEMSVRERNQMFHEVPFTFWMSKSKYIYTNTMELDQQKNQDVIHGDVHMSHEKAAEHENKECDLSVDLTDLETFGGTCNPLKKFKKPSSPVKPKNVPGVLLSKLELEKKIVSTGTSNPEDNQVKVFLQRTEPTSLPDQNNRACSMSVYESLFSDSDDAQSFKGFASDEIEEFVESDSDTDNKEVSENNSEILPIGNSSMAETSTEEVVRTTSCASDTDEERLVIDTECKDNESCFKIKVGTASKAIPETPKSPLQALTKSKNSNIKQSKCALSKPTKRLSKDVDPVGQILKMQDKLMKVNPKKAIDQPMGSPNKGSPVRPTEKSSLPPVVLSPPPSNADKATTLAESLTTETHLLPEELQRLREDLSEYTDPGDGNVVYKLFSLDGMLLLVRCSVQKVKSVSKHQLMRRLSTRHLPVLVLPKVEYQASYGVEALTESEVCRLWTESLLHSCCTFYIGHIDALSSALFMLEELTADGIKEKFGTFKPTNSLNILRHILKKVTDLQEGSYLLSHKAGDSSVSIYKSTPAKASRTPYNLHKAHSRIPQVPSTLSVPWVPLDPTILLPYHVAQGRIPCTFPPRPEGITDRNRVGGPENQRWKHNPGKRISGGSKCSDVSVTATKGVSPKKKTNKGKWANKNQKWQNQRKSRKPGEMQETP
ncbi:little elongation complex subunit 2 [Ambystoma mexicanum]|uniref:little elongation complex subunit 2 n=1 Tax=Ambystoma mexicanum TaxID=8296 RepID=UPI0037E8551C